MPVNPSRKRERFGSPCTDLSIPRQHDEMVEIWSRCWLISEKAHLFWWWSMFIYVYLCLWLFYRISDLFGGDPELTSEIFKYPKPLKLLKKWGKGVTWQLLIQWQLGVLIIRGLSILCTIWVGELGESLGKAEFVHCAGMKHDTYQQLVSTP